MRYALRPENLRERAALATGSVPRPVIDVLVPLLTARAIMAGVEHGVFANLADGPLTLAELGARCRADGAALGLLLRVLVAAGYLDLRGDRFSLSPGTGTRLVPGSSSDLSSYVEFGAVQWNLLGQLETLVATGRGLDLHRLLPEGDAAWSAYHRAMLDLARPVARLFARAVPVPRGATTLVDLGGSHGLFGAALCRAHPPLRSTVFELPASVDAARAVTEQAGIADVVTHVAADMTSAPLGRDVDVVLLCNVLHHHPPDDVDGLLARISGALKPRGTLAIWETELPDPSAPPELLGDALALYFRLTSSADPLTPAAIARTLERQGFVEIGTRRFLRAPGRVLIHARRP
jgi:SAM-dependent methyltransferase